MKPRFALSALALAASAAALGCDFRLGSPERASSGPYPIHDFAMLLATQEGDTTRHLLVVGDSGIATILAFGWDAACSFHGCEQPLDAQFSGSDAKVVTPARQSVHGFAEFAFLARAPGSAELTAVTQGKVISARVDVVTQPLPVDSVRVRRWPLVGDSVLATVTDAAGNLDSLTVPHDSVLSCAWCHYWATLRVLVFRNGDSTVYLPTAIQSTDSTVVLVGIGRQFSVTGLSPGTATVTVSARGQRYSFVVKVALIG